MGEKNLLFFFNSKFSDKIMWTVARGKPQRSTKGIKKKLFKILLIVHNLKKN